MQTLHQNLINSAACYPDKDAFCCGKERITYQQLDELSSRLASYLRHLGVTPTDRVAIRLGPSVQTAISVYAVLKSGAAFVPIDPSLPKDRLVQLLEVGGISHLITSDSDCTLQDELPHTLPSLKAVIQDNESARHPWDNIEDFQPISEVSADAAKVAYVIFTSGSTGQPKGIVHTHTSGNSYARLSAELYGVTPQDRIANLSPLHFDMSTFGFLTSVYAGATCVLVPQSNLVFPACMSSLVEVEKVSIWYSVPFALIQMLNRGAIDQRDLSSLRWILFGGEPFPPYYVNLIREHAPNARLSNVYGPAEVNQCTYFHIPSRSENRDPVPEQPIPIGKAWDETSTLVVDSRCNDVQPGQTGELLVNSTTMMQGYWDSGMQDSQVFYERDGVRYYRTGDLVTEDDRGRLLFLGRKDRQVKIRGYRVELDEIEHHANSHPDVVECAVVVLNRPQSQIYAIVTCDSKSITENQLRRFLADRLPAYMVPERAFVVDSFPRTSSSKIDRNAVRSQLQQNKFSTAAK